jgi:hypothetical protein
MPKRKQTDSGNKFDDDFDDEEVSSNGELDSVKLLILFV